MFGDAVFWILIVLAVASFFAFLGRFMNLRHAQIDYQDFLKGVINVLASGSADEALANCDDAGVPVANVVATAIRHRDDSARLLREAVDSQGRAEIGRLDRRLATIAIIGQIAPLLGLLGTVIGFVHTLKAVNGAEIVARTEMISTAMNALVDTGVGLVVAILTVVMYGALRVRLDRIVVELEAAASQIVGFISTQKELHR